MDSILDANGFVFGKIPDWKKDNFQQLTNLLTLIEPFIEFFDKEQQKRLKKAKKSLEKESEKLHQISTEQEK